MAGVKVCQKMRIFQLFQSFYTPTTINKQAKQVDIDIVAFLWGAAFDECSLKKHLEINSEKPIFLSFRNTSSHDGLHNSLFCCCQTRGKFIHSQGGMILPCILAEHTPFLPHHNHTVESLLNPLEIG